MTNSRGLNRTVLTVAINSANTTLCGLIKINNIASNIWLHRSFGRLLGPMHDHSIRSLITFSSVQFNWIIHFSLSIWSIMSISITFNSHNRRSVSYHWTAQRVISKWVVETLNSSNRRWCIKYLKQRVSWLVKYHHQLPQLSRNEAVIWFFSFGVQVWLKSHTHPFNWLLVTCLNWIDF